jgi:hypothetical protein
MDNEIRAHIIETLGCNQDHEIYAFSNAVYTSNKTVRLASDAPWNRPHMQVVYGVLFFDLQNPVK